MQRCSRLVLTAQMDRPMLQADMWMGDTVQKLKKAGIDVESVLDNNDANHALEKCGGLIFTGATGTNVNDITVLLIRGN